MLKFISIAIVWLASIMPATAQTQALPTTDILLVLAVDTSGSVNQTRFELQRRGYADAFRSQQVLNAIRGGSTGSIAVTMVQWTGPSMQVQVVPWTLVKDAGSALAFADAIEAAPRQLFGGGTSLSGAIDHAMLLLPGAPYRGLKRVIDVSGDGSNNRGRDVREARDEAVRAGVIINGLPIVSLEYDLDKYYFNNVIGGPGSFIVPADSYDNFAQAVLRKLVLEIASADTFIPPQTPALFVSPKYSPRDRARTSGSDSHFKQPKQSVIQKAKAPPPLFSQGAGSAGHFHPLAHEGRTLPHTM